MFAMRKRLILFVSILGVLIMLFREAPIQSDAQTSDDGVYIFSPQPGEALQGTIPVEVSLIVSRMENAGVAFRYADHPTGTWFLIGEVSDSIPDGVAANWDTTVITDGVYDLRLYAVTRSGEELEYIVPGLRVRNYSPVETSTPTSFVPTETLYPGQVTQTLEVTETILPPTVTPQPTNPGVLTTGQFSQSLKSGAVITASIFLLIGAYLAVKTRILDRV
jgi:hypothetical protein